MIVVVDEHLFQDDHARDVDRIALLRLIGLRRHGMLSAPEPKPKAKSSVPDPLLVWCNGLRGRLSRETQKVIAVSRAIPVATTVRGGTRVLVSDRWGGQRGSLLLSLDTAIRVLSEPLHVLVENGLRDAEFVRRIMPSDWRERFSQWEKTGRVRFENAGGIDEMREIVSSMASADGASTGWGIPAHAWRLAHYLIFDHDGDVANSPSPSSTRLERACEQCGLTGRWHRLQRRRQEHYLPREAMRWIAEHELTDPGTRRDSLDAIEGFFQGDRSYGSLPDPSANFWKNRFWHHRDASWDEGWFQSDGATDEGRSIAEDLERLL